MQRECSSARTHGSSDTRGESKTEKNTLQFKVENSNRVENFLQKPQTLCYVLYMNLVDEEEAMTVMSWVVPLFESVFLW